MSTPRTIALCLSLAALGAVLVPSAATAAPPPLRVGDPYAVRGGTLEVNADGCDGTAAIFLYSGSGPTRTIAGYAEDTADLTTLLYVPWWIPADIDLTIEASCLLPDGSDAAFEYPAAAVDLRPDVSDPDSITGTLSPSQVMAGQRITYSGGPCTVGAVDPSSLVSMLLVFSGDDPADPGLPSLVGGGTVDNGVVGAEGVVFGADIEPGDHVVLPLCSNFEAWQALPFSLLTVTPNTAAATMTADVTPNRRVAIAGEGCTSGDVSLFVESYELLATRSASAKARRAFLDAGEPNATVTPDTDGSWTFVWPGPAPRNGTVLITAVCGDIEGESWAYDQVVLDLETVPPTTSPSTTTTTAPRTPQAPGARPISTTPTYTG